MATGLEYNGKSINLTIIKKRYRRGVPNFEQARKSIKCEWCKHFDFKISNWCLCKKHYTLVNKLKTQCRYIGRGKYIKGMGKSAWEDLGNRRPRSWFEEIDFNEYNRRVVMMMEAEKRYRDKQNSKRSYQRWLKREEKRINQRVGS